MNPKELFFLDERLDYQCIYCLSGKSTVEHVPSKVLLDKPYPPNLPVVNACKSCNHGFSKDEQYFACFIDCVKNDSVDTNAKLREKVRRILDGNTTLAARILASRNIDINGNVYWIPEHSIFENIILKLARGHVNYEISELKLSKPEHLIYTTYNQMSEEDVKLFSTPTVEYILPELGSRKSLHLVGYDSEYNVLSGWKVVQDGRYRYLVSSSNRILVRIVVSEFLVCEVIW